MYLVLSQLRTDSDWIVHQHEKVESAVAEYSRCLRSGFQLVYLTRILPVTISMKVESMDFDLEEWSGSSGVL